MAIAGVIRLLENSAFHREDDIGLWLGFGPCGVGYGQSGNAKLSKLCYPVIRSLYLRIRIRSPASKQLYGSEGA